MQAVLPTPEHQSGGFLRRLARDRAGNTMVMIAAALAPLLAMAGGGIDMGRSYLAQAKLQAACDAGVLAARKRLGSAVAANGLIPDGAEQTGADFFNANFQNGAYGTQNRDFTMRLESDYAVTGHASVDVPTTIMAIFGHDRVSIEVDCQARLNFQNTDVLMVLDTTGSMAQPINGAVKMETLRSVVQNFHAQLEGSKAPGTRIRYGFLPYSTNVNVGHLLKSDWVVDQWDYRGRVAKDSGTWESYTTYNTKQTDVSGSYATITPYTAAACPDSTAIYKVLSQTKDYYGNEKGRTSVTGNYYWCTIAPDGANVTVNGTRYTNYVYDWTKTKTGTATRPIYKWQYRTVAINLRTLKGATGDDPLVSGSIARMMSGTPASPSPLTAYFRGCMEERATYAITDYDDVDFSRALDLDIDLVPTPGDPATQWRPMLHEFSYEPEIWSNGTGTFRKNAALTTNDYLMAEWYGLSACPSPARKLAEMTAGEVASYVNALEARGSTYHDIGMIWGGRMLSRDGLFAAENADVDGRTTSRHLIFLTDGETAPQRLSYGTYGIEPLDERRCTGCTNEQLTQIVENRFAVACREVKKRNITVWVIGFGVSLNPIMTECAGEGHFFEAANATELSDVFSRIAASMGDLRISR